MADGPWPYSPYDPGPYIGYYDELESVLEDARGIVDSRDDTHGDFARNHDHIAQVWNWYLSQKSEPLVASDVARMMLLVKVVRAISEGYNADDDEDSVGYAAIAAALAACENQNTQEGDD